MQILSSNHAVHEIGYHLLWTSKYRRAGGSRSRRVEAHPHGNGVTNLSGFEYMNRAAGHPPAEQIGASGAVHIGHDQLRAVLHNLSADEEELGRSVPGLEQLREAAQEAQTSCKSLVIVPDHVSFDQAARGRALTEDLNHAVQRAATGPLRDHLKGSAQPFIEGTLGRRAVNALETEFGYRFRSPGDAATEIGVRLMQRGQYRELGLSGAEAHTLALEYVQRLEKEYGRAAVSQIRARILDAFLPSRPST